MPLRRLILTAFVTCLMLVISRPCLAQADQPQLDWVFNERGQKTGQVKVVDGNFDDAWFPININNHWGLMNQDGNVVVYPRFEWTDYSYDGIARYVQGGKTGYLRGDPANDDDPREFFVKASFDYADRFSSGAAVVMNDGKWGMIDKAGKVLLPMQFDGVLRMQDGFAAVQKDGKCGFVNRTGDLKIPLQYKRVRSFHDGYAAVQFQNDTWGYINKTGKVVWQDKSGNVTQLGDFHEGYAKVQGKVGNTLRWGYITKAFRFRVDPIYDDARDFHHGMAAVKTQGKWGFITAAGRWAIQPIYDEVDDFDDAEHSNDFEDVERERGERKGQDLSTASVYAMVKRDGRWGYINRVGSGGMVPQFQEAHPFYRGLARVSRDDSFAYVTETGKVGFDPRVAIQLGFVDLTGREDGRGKVVRDTVGTRNTQLGDLSRTTTSDGGLGNQVYDAPTDRPQAHVPYVAEHLYGETLPVEE